jgi:outer membrane protein OmpA-like peptidoglycan-associated protein
MKRLVILASVLALGFLGACASMENGMKDDKMAAKPAAEKKKPAAAKKKKMPPSGSPFTIYFKNNEVDLTEKSHGDMFDIQQKIPVYKPKAITVTVYSDLTGSAAYNKELAEKRGKMIADKLKGAGGKNVKVDAVGAADPIVERKGKVDANRRAVISFKK